MATWCSTDPLPSWMCQQTQRWEMGSPSGSLPERIPCLGWSQTQVWGRSSGVGWGLQHLGGSPVVLQWFDCKHRLCRVTLCFNTHVSNASQVFVYLKSTFANVNVHQFVTKSKDKWTQEVNTHQANNILLPIPKSNLHHWTEKWHARLQLWVSNILSASETSCLEDKPTVQG